MSLFSPTTWQERIRSYATLMIATITLLIIAIVSLISIDRLETEEILSIQSNYHLSTALAATSAELEINKIYRSINLLRDRNNSFNSIKNNYRWISPLRSSLHIVKQNIDILRLPNKAV